MSRFVYGTCQQSLTPRSLFWKWNGNFNNHQMTSSTGLHPKKWVLVRSPVNFLTLVLVLCTWIKNIAVRPRSCVLGWSTLTSIQGRTKCTYSKNILHLKILSTFCPWIDENVLHPRTTHFSGCWMSTNRKPEYTDEYYFTRNTKVNYYRDYTWFPPCMC